MGPHAPAATVFPVTSATNHWNWPNCSWLLLPYNLTTVSPMALYAAAAIANRLGAAGGIRLSRSLSNTKSHSVFAIPPCRIYRRPAERSFRLVPVSYCVLRSPRTARNWSLAHTPTTLLSIFFLILFIFILFFSPSLSLPFGILSLPLCTSPTSAARTSTV